MIPLSFNKTLKSWREDTSPRSVSQQAKLLSKKLLTLLLFIERNVSEVEQIVRFCSVIFSSVPAIADSI